MLNTHRGVRSLAEFRPPGPFRRLALGGADVPQPLPDVVPSPSPHPMPPSPPTPPEITEPPMPDQHPPISDPVAPAGRQLRLRPFCC